MEEGEILVTSGLEEIFPKGMDDVPVEAVRKFEEGLLEYCSNSKSEILAEIRDKAKLDDGLIAKLGAAIDEFKKGFKA